MYWDMTGSRCGIGLCRHVKVREAHEDLQPYDDDDDDDGKLLWRKTFVNLLKQGLSVWVLARFSSLLIVHKPG